MYKDHFFTVSPGIQVRYIDEGEGTPILFIPGWSYTADVFERQIAYFKDKYRCVAFEPRCHGKSTITHEGNTYTQQGRDIAGLIEHLQLKNIVIVGWSFGALACWAYAEQFGITNIAAMVCLDNAPRSISDDETEYRAGTLEDLRGAHINAFSSISEYRKFLEQFVDGLLFEKAPDPKLRQVLIEAAFKIPYEIADFLYIDGWLADKRDIVKKLDDALPNLLVVANYRKEAGVSHVKKTYPNTEVHAFGMHMMFYEYADKFNTIFEEFLTNRVKKNI